MNVPRAGRRPSSRGPVMRPKRKGEKEIMLMAGQVQVGGSQVKRFDAEQFVVFGPGALMCVQF